jgi:hypothetical protein
LNAELFKGHHIDEQFALGIFFNFSGTGIFLKKREGWEMGLEKIWGGKRDQELGPSLYATRPKIGRLGISGVPLSRRAGLEISKKNEEMFYSEAKYTAFLILNIYKY